VPAGGPRRDPVHRREAVQRPLEGSPSRMTRHPARPGRPTRDWLLRDGASFAWEGSHGQVRRGDFHADLHRRRLLLGVTFEMLSNISGDATEARCCPVARAGRWCPAPTRSDAREQQSAGGPRALLTGVVRGERGGVGHSEPPAHRRKGFLSHMRVHQLGNATDPGNAAVSECVEMIHCLDQCGSHHWTTWSAADHCARARRSRPPAVADPRALARGDRPRAGRTRARRRCVAHPTIGGRALFQPPPCRRPAGSSRTSGPTVPFPHR
jgi:hypothetical protein